MASNVDKLLAIKSEAPSDIPVEGSSPLTVPQTGTVSNVDKLLGNRSTLSAFPIRKKSSDDFLGRMGVAFDESQKSFFEGLDVFADMAGVDWLSDVAEAGVARQEKDISEYAPQTRSASVTEGIQNISKIYEEEGFMPAFGRLGTLAKDMLATGLGSFGISGATAVGSVAAAPFTMGTSLVLPFLVEGTMGAGAIRQTAKELGATDEDADMYATIGAGPMAVVGRFGAAKVVGGLVKAAGLKKVKEELTEAYGEEVASTVLSKTFKTLAEGTKGGIAEAGTEGIQAGMEMSLAGLAADKGLVPYEGAEYTKRVIDDIALGFTAGAPVATAGNFLSDAARKQALKQAEFQERLMAAQNVVTKEHEDHMITRAYDNIEALPENRVLRFIRNEVGRATTALTDLANRNPLGNTVKDAFDTFYDLKSVLAADKLSEFEKVMTPLKRGAKVPFMRDLSKDTDMELGRVLSEPDYRSKNEDINKAGDYIRNEILGRKLQDDIKLNAAAIDASILGNQTAMVELVKTARDMEQSHDTRADFIKRLSSIKETVNGLRQEFDTIINKTTNPQSADAQMAALNKIKQSAKYKALTETTLRQGKFTGRLGEMRQAGIPVDFLEGYLPVKYLLGSSKQRKAAEKVLMENGVDRNRIIEVFDRLAEQEWKDSPVDNLDGWEFNKEGVQRKSSEAASTMSFEKSRSVPEDIRDILRKNGFVDQNTRSLISEYIVDSSHRIASERLKNAIDNLFSTVKPNELSATEFTRIRDLYRSINHRYKAPITEGGKLWKKTSNWAQSAGYILTMPLSALTALSEPMIVMTALGPKYALRGFIDASYTGLVKSLRTVLPRIPLTRQEEAYNTLLQGMDGALAERFGDLQETSMPRRVNNAFFKATGLMQVTQLSRYMAYSASKQALYDDAKALLADVDETGKPTSREGVRARGRLMRFYGIPNPANNQYLKQFVDSGGKATDNPLINMAMSKAVDDTIMAPNPVNRPMIMNNPHLALIFQLKSFVTVFGNTVGYRMYRDIFKPLYGSTEASAKAAIGLGMVMAVALASQGLRDAIRYPDGESPYDELDGLDKIFHAIFNTGIFGAGTFLRDLMIANQFGSNAAMAAIGPIPAKVFELIDSLGSGNPRTIARYIGGVTPGFSGLPIDNDLKADYVGAIESGLIDAGMSSKRKHGGKIVKRAEGGSIIFGTTYDNPMDDPRRGTSNGSGSELYDAATEGKLGSYLAGEAKAAYNVLKGMNFEDMDILDLLKKGGTALAEGLEGTINKAKDASVRAVAGEEYNPTSILEPVAEVAVGSTAFSAPKGALRIFGGANAKKAPLDTLQKAKEALDNPNLSEEAKDTIWQQTGWFKDPSGDMKFEIDDSTSKIDYSMPLENVRKISDVLEHPQLFNNYPEIAEYPLTFSDKLPNSVWAEFNPYTKQITVNRNNNTIMGDERMLRKTLLHELQHSVQELEGFNKGGNSTMFTPSEYGLEGDADNLDIALKVQDKFKDFYIKNEYDNGKIKSRIGDTNTKEVLSNKDLGLTRWEYNRLLNILYTTPVEQLERFSKGEKQFIDDLKALAYNKTSIPEHRQLRYLDLYGEHEARRVEDRLDMSEMERGDERPNLDDFPALIKYKGTEKDRPLVNQSKKKEGGIISKARQRWAADGGTIAEATGEPNIDMDLTSVENQFRELKGEEPRSEAFSMPSADVNTIAYLESRGKPDAVNKSSGATGTFQITPSTAEWLGHDPEKLLDPEYNKQVFFDYAERNAQSLQKYLDRPVEPFDIYMTHQQGMRGYLQLNQFKDRKIRNIKSKDIKRNVRNNMLPVTRKRKNPSIEDWLNDWRDHYEATKAKMLDSD